MRETSQPQAYPAVRHDEQVLEKRDRPVAAPTSFDMEALVGYILLAGVLVSMSLILAGMAWRYVNTGSISFDYQITGMNFFEFLLRDIQQVTTGQLRPRLLVSLGIATLMLTPFLRVLASMLYFMLAAHNWKYTAFTAFVLGVLSYSLFLR
jgi:uncharacterized membrane protein